MSRRCEACGAMLDGRGDRRYCSNRCRQRAYRMRAAARHGEPWQSIAHRLELDAPERWALSEPRVVYRDVDADDDLLGELSDDDELLGEHAEARPPAP